MFPLNETLGQYSELFMLLAAGTYTVALIAFAWDLAKSSQALKAVDLKADTAALLAAPAPARVPVAAGGVAEREPDGAADARTDRSGPEGRAERPTSVASRAGDGQAPAQRPMAT